MAKATNQLPRTLRMLASPWPIRGNSSEIMHARLWESARNNRGVAKIRAGRKMRREEDEAKERQKRGTERTRGLYASTKWVMALAQIYQLLHFRRRLGRLSRLGSSGIVSLVSQNSRSPGSETVSGVIRVFFEGGLGSATSMKWTVRPEKNMRPVLIDRRV